MKKRRIVAASLILAAACALPCAAYSPTVVAGVTAYGGHGSADPDLYVGALGPGVDIDFRTAVGEAAYLAAWYSGDLWFATGMSAPSDQQDAGFLLGGPLRNLMFELRAATALSTPLGDEQLTVNPDWSISLEVPVAERVGLEVDYAGFYNLEPDTDRGRLHNSVAIALRFDPSIEFGIRAGAAGSYAVFPNRFVLDSSGVPTSERRRDLGANVTLATEGLIRYFTLWGSTLTAEMVLSNANQYLASTGTVEERSSDRLSLGIDGSISSSPAESVGLETRVWVGGTRYPYRSSLDSSGGVVAPTTSLLQLQGSVRVDWNPAGRFYVVIGAAGEYALSDDAGMSGWNFTGDVGLQYRL